MPPTPGQLGTPGTGYMPMVADDHHLDPTNIDGSNLKGDSLSTPPSRGL